MAVEQQISWIFQNTPNFLILDDFHSIYCHFLIKGHPVFSRHLYEKIKEKIIFHSLLHKKEHVRTIICLYHYFYRKKIWRVNLVSAIDLPLVQAGMHELYTGHITHWTRFGMKYYAKNVVPVFCVSCASVHGRAEFRYNRP